jgi:hypothetical protein
MHACVGESHNLCQVWQYAIDDLRPGVISPLDSPSEKITIAASTYRTQP